MTISHMRRHAPFELIDPNSCVWGGVHDVINCANFFENRSRGLGAGIPRKTASAFPIESVHRPYSCNVITLLRVDMVRIGFDVADAVISHTGGRLAMPVKLDRPTKY